MKLNLRWYFACFSDEALETMGERNTNSGIFDSQWYTRKNLKIKIKNLEQFKLTLSMIFVFHWIPTDPQRFRFTRQTTFLRRHMNNCATSPILLWIVSEIKTMCIIWTYVYTIFFGILSTCVWLRRNVSSGSSSIQ